MAGDTPEHSESFPREFTTTRWSLVLRAGGTSPEQAQVALEQLCCDYWYPLYAFVRRKGHSPEEAADLTQEFFARLLARDFARGVAPEGGRFRSFLLTALSRFLIKEWHKGQRQKRGGNAFIQSLDALIQERGEASYVAEVSHSQTPVRLYERAWAETLLARVLERLKRETDERMPGLFATLYPYLSSDEQAPKLEEAAVVAGTTLPALKSKLQRFRQRHRELLLEEIGQTVGDRSEIAEELRGLLQALQTP